MDDFFFADSTHKLEATQSPEASQRRRIQRKIKRVLDVSVALALLILFFPLLAGLSLLLLVVQGPPILFKHKRIGRNGEAFECLKFRTMVHHAERVLKDHLATNPVDRREWELSRKLRDDPRVTSLGSVMRKASLDELPQLLNVLRGEMSLVGPRPIEQSELHLYGSHVYVYKSVLPGITGPWQVSGRSNVCFDKRVELDAEYVMNWSITKDIVILLKTLAVVVYMKGSC